MGSGMDNTPRFAAGWADISCQQALNALYMTRIAQELGDTASAERYQDEWRTLRDTINAVMWDEQDGFYWDVDGQGMATKAKTVAGFWAMLAEIASPAQIGRLVEHLQDERSFRRMHPFPTLAADHPTYKPHGDYWLGAVWAPTNYMIIKGLRQAGHGDLARDASLRHVEAIERVHRATGTVWENYRADEDAPGIPARPDFVGWNGCGPIALLIEEIIGVEVDAPKRTVHWTIREEGAHGIQQLPFGTTTVDIEIDDDDAISLRAEQPCTLIVEGERRSGRWELDAGQHRLTVSEP